MTPFFCFAYWVTKIVFAICFKVTYIGREKVPDTGGYLIVANHNYLKDPLLLAHSARRQIYFMGKQEFFDHPFMGVLLRWLGAFSVDRGAGDMTAINRGVELIKEGRLVGLFPEGTRRPAGSPMKAKSGAALIARQTGADVIPCGISYGDRKGFRARLTVRYGDPIPYSALGFEDEMNPSSLRKASKLIAAEVNKLREDLNED